MAHQVFCAPVSTASEDKTLDNRAARHAATLAYNAHGQLVFKALYVRG
jgi:hypothetical protein